MKKMIRCFFVTALVAVLRYSPASYAGEYFFAPESGAFPNPDRGWYVYAPILDNDSYAQIGNAGVRLVYGAITLRDFVHSDISDTVITRIRQRFTELRRNGVKAVLRVNYNEEATGTDASMSQMIRHMQQLQQVLEKNKDVIAYIEAGYFGQWGEWHDWCGGGANTNLTDDYCSKHPDNKETWSRIVSELLQYVPEDRFILLRYPGKKQAIFGGDPVTATDVMTGLAKARVGHHNDCFLASSDDMGTYQTFGNSNSVATLKAYLSADTEYLPIGGETCFAISGHRFSCDIAVPEMEQLHWTYLNQEYYSGTLSIWEEGGCKIEIDKRLGYRFELLAATLPEILIKDSTQIASFRIRNAGFTRAYHNRKAYLRLFQGRKIIANMELADIDIRRIGSGETMTFTGTFHVPGNVSEDSVSVALWLPDTDSRNWHNSRFSMRLAYKQNEDDWSLMSSAGHNVLVQDIPVVPAVPPVSNADLDVYLHQTNAR